VLSLKTTCRQSRGCGGGSSSSRIMLCLFDLQESCVPCLVCATTCLYRCHFGPQCEQLKGHLGHQVGAVVAVQDCLLCLIAAVHHAAQSAAQGLCWYGGARQ
jgi:hypothetical protein